MIGDNKKIIPIALAADNNYVIPLGVTIFSILCNKKNNHSIEFFILDGGITDIEKEKIINLINSYDSTSHFIPISDVLKDKNLPEIGRLNKMAYARLFIPEMIKKEKVIYLDTDIIVNGDLQDFYDLKFDSAFAAMNEPEMLKIIKRKNNPILNKYFNSGVLIINTDKWQKLDITNKALDFAIKYPEKIETADQDALNYTCQGLWSEFDKKYNHEVIYNETNDSEDSVITHYIGDIKPWHYEYPNKIGNYAKYANSSPWKNIWQTSPSFKKIYKKLWLSFKLKLKAIPGLEMLINKIRFKYNAK
ncbi:MAG: hypothetical protein US81_C0006G0023 [Parcubacteria group bacterium GW2011_GWE2_38_18]|nr:MAG: hypothetical protein US81_C0006G0023 [Parcubacteria group bacterium GW2011_GWE2_38_18]